MKVVKALSKTKTPIVSITLNGPLTAFLFGEVRRTKNYEAGTAFDDVSFAISRYETRDEVTPWVILEKIEGSGGGILEYGVPFPRLRTALKNELLDIEIDGEWIDEISGLEALLPAA